MRAAILHSKQNLTVETLPEPQPAADEVILKVSHTGICGTDLHEYQHGPMFTQPSIVLGHETSGTVVETGSSVDDITIGTRVTIIPMDYCGKCYYCRHAKFQLCDNQIAVGFGRNGAFSNYVSVPRRLVVAIPDALDLELAALTEHITVAFHAVRRSQLQVGESVLVLGAGPVGLAAVQCAVAAGARRIIVTEPASLRRQTALQLGASAALDPTTGVVGEEIFDLTDGVGVDVVIDAAGNQSALDAGFSALRKQGRFVEIASWNTKPNLDMNVHLLRETQILFAFGYDMYDEFPAVLDLMARGVIDARKQITDYIGLENIVKDGFEALLNGRGTHIKILVSPNAA
jgi:(R,R)-butanediol dehydrogenase / meso-butanediol dehydrogenase / diacetyl reductase